MPAYSPAAFVTALLLLLLPASPAWAAVTVEGPQGDAMIPRLQQWTADDAMPAGDGDVSVVPENCVQMQAAACTFWNLRPRFVMYFPDLEYLWSQSGVPDAERAATRLNYYHELGHVLDFSLTHHAYRLAWFRIMGYRRMLGPRREHELAVYTAPPDWFTARDRHGRSVVPAEQFAQAYDYCAESMSYAEVRETIRTTYWGFGYDPSIREYLGACQLIRGL